jgi:hypothetical protein
MYDGRFALTQPIARAEAGVTVELVVDILFAGWEIGGTLVFEIERGHLGWTEAKLFEFVGGEPLLVETLEWNGIASGERNAATFNVSADILFDATP